MQPQLLRVLHKLLSSQSGKQLHTLAVWSQLKVELVLECLIEHWLGYLWSNTASGAWRLKELARLDTFRNLDILEGI